MKKWISILTLSLTVFALTVTPSHAKDRSSLSSITPLSKAHAHNDYEHNKPLQDALDHGFTSVEADVWLKDGKLLVAHDQIDLKPDRTLESLYLAPLKKRIKSNGGSVYKGYKKQDFLLWIDIKSEDAATYKAIHEKLTAYKNMLTRISGDDVDQGAVTVIISGNRPYELMKSQKTRYSTNDGRMSDLGMNFSNTFMPVISDNWTKHFTWQGIGPMPEEEKKKLHHIVKTAHTNGQIVRFWATPDAALPNREAVWQELMNAGVDLINTDDLPGLQQFLLKNDTNPTSRHIDW
ncbi:phosphatidylinositol-specific phospholipase C/glycerophosphodiester phosphodiesterase family protein [Fictibacillus nanhaiensis]|uniref:phosphatidylinositol-specific phospholipase C/glycerophosphodiester phosphodiesterase family protein n=1 Tax=Fictibacillus nanhaiensis TaxID=742169 RepID=UPI001C951EBD|nr:phosphatidylinositol-specific phospholipase C/glycerophosphodiester phosphodiesterase family protein [Fictibacillus nanhaiensis]MBY6037669.1 phosphatidylinositol-specific phospholipase C/glycerophosphodiester phosphodiesterase family protein [Fictibacillus nanhaiensis]